MITAGKRLSPHQKKIDQLLLLLASGKKADKIWADLVKTLKLDSFRVLMEDPVFCSWILESENRLALIKNKYLWTSCLEHIKPSCIQISSLPLKTCPLVHTTLFMVNLTKLMNLGQDFR